MIKVDAGLTKTVRGASVPDSVLKEVPDLLVLLFPAR